jgi:NAD dependent epimerase/dehydratase family enzyme
MEHALHSAALVGPVNLVAPHPVTNAEFATTLGHVLSRPAVIPVPAFALEALYGEMARATLLAGQRVVPRALLDDGFAFAHVTLENALRAELG